MASDDELTAAEGQIQGDRPKKRTRIVVLSIIGGLAVLLGAAYVTGYFMTGDRLPRNTSMNGIAIGGLSAEEAEDKLATEFADDAAQGMTVVAGEEELPLDPVAAGLSVDYHATVQGAGVGKSWNPVHIWRVLTGGGRIQPVTDVDLPTLESAVASMAKYTVDRDPKDASVTFDEEGKVQQADGVEGRTLDQPDAVTKIQDAYLQTDRVNAVVQTSEPQVTTEAASTFVTEWAGKLVQGPVSVDTGQGTFEISEAVLASAAEIKTENGEFTGTVNVDKLYENSQSAIEELDLKSAKDASYKFEGGNIVVVPAVDGSEVTKESFQEVILPATTSDERDVKVELSGAKAEFSTEEAEKRKPREVIGEFTTSFPHADYRNTNLSQFASAVSGASLRPGETFSVDEHVGPRNAASGYVDGYVIEGGVLRKQSAGGISQGATTLYNAAWFAGLEDIEHQPHTMYFDRYPAGREATLYYGSIDLKFKNTTDNAVMITGSVNPSSSGGKGSITFKIWGVKQWEVESPEPTKSDYYDGGTITDDSAECEPQSASPGFTASYYRVITENGESRREDKTWKYNATDKVVCK